MKTYEIRPGSRNTKFAAAKKLAIALTIDSDNWNGALERELAKAAKAAGVKSDTIFVTTADSNYVRTMWL